MCWSCLFRRSVDVIGCGALLGLAVTAHARGMLGYAAVLVVSALVLFVDLVTYRGCRG